MIGRRVDSTRCVRRPLAVGSAALGLTIVALVQAANAEGPEDAQAETATVGVEVIVVTGTRSETPLDASPVVTEVIDRARIEESGAETVAEVLALRPGLWLERGIGGTGITIQGLGPEYVLVMIDGQRQIGRVGGTIDLDRIGVGDVERIEIVRGPSSALYGSDALGGVINVIRREPDEGVAADGAARIDGRLATDLRGRFDAADRTWSGGAGAQWRRGDAYDRNPSDPSTTVAAYEDLRAGADGTWRRGDRARIEAGGDYLRRDLRAVSATASGAVFDRANLIEVASARAGARWATDETVIRGGVGFGAYRDQYLSDQRDSNALDRYEETMETLAEASGQVEHVRGRHRATAGGEMLREVLDADRLATMGERWRGALFLQDEWRPGDAYRWLVVPAVRLDHDSQFGTHATPRLAVRWDPIDRVVLRGSTGMGFRAPSFKELLLRFENPGVGYVVEGNPDLEPERSISAQGGAEWRPSAALWLAANAFHNELENLITSVTLDDGGAGGSIRFGYDNVGRARTQGIEATAALVRGRVGFELGWAYTRARDLDMGRALEGVPAHRVAAALRWRDREEALDATVEAALTGPRAFYLSEDPAEATWTDPGFEIRARIARRFGDHLSFFLGVENLLDAGDDRYDPLAPRTLYTGVEARR